MKQVRIKATVEIVYVVDMHPEAYPGCETASDVGEYEADLLDGEGDYLISMMSMDSASVDVVTVESTDFP